MEHWTAEEDRILKEVYGTGSRKEILSKFPNKIWRSIYRRSVRLNLPKIEEEKWSEKDENVLKDLYPNTSKEIILKTFPNRTWKAITWHAIYILHINRTKEISQAETRKTNLNKLGVEYPTQSALVREKVRETVQDRYGCDNVFQNEEIKEKIVQTNMEKYGVANPQQSKEIQDRTKNTNQEKYGVDNTFQLVDRVKEGMMKKYGADSPLRVPELKEKQQATNLKKYGFIAPSQNQQVKEKLIKTLNTEEVKRKKYETLKKNDSFGTSKEEDSFLIYLREIDENTKDHLIHPSLNNIMDYYSPKYDLWIQYDGVYWHGKKGVQKESRQAKRIREIMEQDQYQTKNIPNLIRFWSDDVNEAINNKTIIDLIKNRITEKLMDFNPVCHQYRKKMEYYNEDIKTLPFNPDNIKARQFNLSVESVSEEIVKFIEKYEWLGTIGHSPKWCFTARFSGILGGVVLINEPTAYSKILGEETPKYEALIQRGASASWAPKNLGSRLIMFACSWMSHNTSKRAFIGYADSRANERGIIYRACGFEYLGDIFGNSYLYKHPDIDHDFSSQELKRTSSFRRWCKNNNLIIKKEWFKENGFKNLKEIPEDIKRSW
jgi:hypothetical protein